MWKARWHGGGPWQPGFQVDMGVSEGVEDALRHHCVGYFHESGDVGAIDVVDVSVVFAAEFYATVVYSGHYFAQAVVDFLCGPRQFL